MRMKTTLLYRLKERVRGLFGLVGLYNRPNKEVIVRMDLLNHNTEKNRNNNRYEDFVKELIDEFQSGDNSLQSVKEQFQSLPFSRISEEAMVEIIRIVRLDIEHQNTQNLRKYPNASIMEQLENDMKQSVN